MAGKTTFFIANEIKYFKKWIENEKSILDRKISLLERAQKEVEEIEFKDKNILPRLRYIDNNRIKTFLHEELEKWNKSVKNTDGSWWGFQDVSFANNFDDWINYWFKEKSSKSLVVRLLTNDKKVEIDLKNNTSIDKSIRLVKYLDEDDNDFESTVWVVGHYVVFLNTKTKPFSAIEVYNKDLAKNLRGIFKILWKKV